MPGTALVSFDAQDGSKAFPERRPSWKLPFANAKKKKHGDGGVCDSRRLDETYIKIKGKDRYLYRAVDKHGKTVDFLVTAKRDHKAAQRFLARAIKSHGVSRVITVDKSDANIAAIKAYNAEQDHPRMNASHACHANGTLHQGHKRRA